MNPVKTITIDQRKPGMFIVGMDLSWYRTPFLFSATPLPVTQGVSQPAGQEMNVSSAPLDTRGDDKGVHQPDYIENLSPPMEPAPTDGSTLPPLDAQEQAETAGIYDCMVTRRGGRPALLPHDATRQPFRLGDTGQYATYLVQALISSLGVYPIGSLVLLNMRKQAVVVGMNQTQRLKPIVNMMTRLQGGPYLIPIRVALETQTVGPVARTIRKVMDPRAGRVNAGLFLDGIEREAA